MASISCVTTGCQPANAVRSSATSPRSVHDSRVHDRSSNTQTTFSKRPADDEVVHEVGVRSKPYGAAPLQVKVRDPLGWDQAAVSHVPREPGLRGAEQLGADRGVDAVGPDHHVDGDVRTVGEPQPRPIPNVDDRDAAAADLDPLRGYRVGQHCYHVCPVRVQVGEAVAAFDRVPERRLGQQPVVVPAAELEDGGSDRDPRERREQAQSGQDPRAVRERAGYRPRPQRSAWPARTPARPTPPRSSASAAVRPPIPPPTTATASGDEPSERWDGDQVSVMAGLPTRNDSTDTRQHAPRRPRRRR